MVQVTLRPEFRTAGGEVGDLEIEGKYAGTLTLTYREGDRMIGAIQLDKTTLSEREKETVSAWADDYVHALADALRLEECEVLVTYSKFDHIITAYDDIADDARPDDIDPNDRDEYLMEEDGDESKAKLVPFELVMVGEDGNRIEYHIYGQNQQWKAEAFFSVDDTDVFGEVNWMVRPTADEIEAAADLIVSDFDEQEIDTFEIEMKYKDEVLETIELAHHDLLDPSESAADLDSFRSDNNDKQYTVVLIRDDLEALTYDIYEQSRGGLPVGRATVDISRRKITGMIDFREPTASDDRERMATALLGELDKEKDYDFVNLTMMHQNHTIEDIYFENEQVH